jgi:hypothetical protein
MADIPLFDPGNQIKQRLDALEARIVAAYNDFKQQTAPPYYHWNPTTQRYEQSAQEFQAQQAALSYSSLSYTPGYGGGP